MTVFLHEHPGKNSATDDVGMASYMAFVANANPDSLDAAFGKGNEEAVLGIGKALAMYAWFRGDSKVDYPFTNSIKKNHFQECLEDPYSLSEILLNKNSILALINVSPWAKIKFETVSENIVAKALGILLGIDISGIKLLVDILSSVMGVKNIIEKSDIAGVNFAISNFMLSKNRKANISSIMSVVNANPNVFSVAESTLEGINAEEKHFDIVNKCIFCPSIFRGLGNGPTTTVTIASTNMDGTSINTNGWGEQKHIDDLIYLRDISVDISSGSGTTGVLTYKLITLK